MFYERYWINRSGSRLNDFDLKWPILKQFIPRQKDHVIMDLGCGNGEILKEMLTLNPDAKYVGLDVSQYALEEATAKLSGVTFKKIEDGGKFPLLDESVDFIFSSEVIEHVYDTDNFVLEVKRVLRPGGLILLTTPYHGFLKNILIVCFKFESHFDPSGPHIRFFTKRSMFSLLKKNELKPLRFGYFGRFWPIPHCFYVIAKKNNKIVDN